MKSPYPLRISFQLHLPRMWHIGSGMTSGVTDRLVALDGLRQPVLPGSALKGAIRSQCEVLCPSLKFDVIDSHLPDEKLEDFTSLADTRFIIDRLFGSRYQGETLFFKDAILLEEDSDQPANVEKIALMRNRIDRVFGTAAHEALFSTEYSLGNIRAQGEILGTGADLTFPDGNVQKFPYEYSLLVGGLLTLPRVGADQSTGKGWIDVSAGDLDIRWRGARIAPTEALFIFEDYEYYLMERGVTQ